MAREKSRRGLSRRQLLVGGGVGVGLLVAWTVWPRSYVTNLRARPGETVYNAWLKIGRDGHVYAVAGNILFIFPPMQDSGPLTGANTTTHRPLGTGGNTGRDRLG